MLVRSGANTGIAPPPGREVAIGIVLDTETTGADHSKDRIIELGMVRFEFDPESGEVYRLLDTFNGMEDPLMPISPEASKVNGITDEMVIGKHIDDEEVARFVRDASLVIAHNAQFDRKFMESRFPIFEGIDWGCSFTQVDWGGEGFGTSKLDYLATRFGFFYDAHRAMSDCIALLDVLRMKLPSGGGVLASINDKRKQKSYKVSAAGAPFESKDILKAAGYRWDDKARVWHITVFGDEHIKEQAEFLRSKIYAGRTPVLPFEIFNARTLFSARGGAKVSRSIAKIAKKEEVEVGAIHADEVAGSAGGTGNPVSHGNYVSDPSKPEKPKM